ncbi:DUF262 domain-containing protein [Flavobacterium sp. HXWNR69]|uniref:DUF262 domain-containing protein n=1 Tax=Flavobacterium fragile TaxID=2949085 RepID=A0ABT0TH02_9FLAO|nr:DUF262 domain-containing protein [Flavobacterium sp. HXWNR69]MCL9770172.1 DUF262 domain-containing protein [Flavobacterium sp. HXWNR69]
MQEENQELEKLEEELSYEDNYNELPPNDIVAFNELRSCADLLRMYETNQLEIQPDFQRDVVWSKPDQTRFIDSLIKQLPIPSMCISLDYKTDKRQIIDGLQRMSSIINFLSNDEWKLSQLEDIDENLSGKTVHTIKTKFKDLYSRVQNVVIPITVIRCDYSKKSHSEYLFTIFHRLNSGGIKLNNQEIRNCIFNGNLNTLLKELSKSNIIVNTIGEKSRFANEELLLRFFAFNDNLNSYSGKLSTYLNSYMHTNRNLTDENIEQKRSLVTETFTIIYNQIFDEKSIKGIGKTVLEGLLFGISQNIETLKIKDKEHIKNLYAQFLQLEEFSLVNLKEGLAQKEKLTNRLIASKNIFSN